MKDTLASGKVTTKDLPPEKGVMLWEKPEEKDRRATGYTVQERYRSRWLSPSSPYSHLCAGEGQPSGSHPEPLQPLGAHAVMSTD